MLLCLGFKKAKFDDPIESFQIYGTAGIWGMIASILFWPDSGIFWGG